MDPQVLIPRFGVGTLLYGELHVSRQHYEGGRWVLNVLWSWRKYPQRQASCALALSGFWQGTTRKAFLAMLENCLNAPMERPS